MAKRRLYETEVFRRRLRCGGAGIGARIGGRGRPLGEDAPERTGHESIARYSYAYRGPLAKLQHEADREARR